MQKIEHIGIAVKELAISVPLFEKLLNSQPVTKQNRWKAKK